MITENWPELLKVDEVAVILRVSKMTVYRMVKADDLEAHRVGRMFRVKSDSLRRHLHMDVPAA